MDNWLPISTEELNKPQTKEIRGVKVVVYLPPFSIPIAVRGYKDNEHFNIDFKYMNDGGDMDPHAVSLDEHIILYVERHSRRIARIQVDLAKTQVQTISLDLVKAKVSSAKIEQDEASNRQAILEALEQKNTELNSELTSAAS